MISEPTVSTRTTAAEESPSADLPRVSPWLFRQFLNYTRWYLRRHFREVLIYRETLERLPAETPLLVFMNHPCWWDPLIGLIVAGDSFPERTHYGAMDADALESYGIFKSLGFFGVERGSIRGAVQFLRMAAEITHTPGSALWITPQGRYADVRERPVTLLAGSSHVLSRLEHGVVIPLALEYAFWDERLPIAAAEFGDPIDLSTISGRNPRAWDEHLSAALAETQDRLSRKIIQRDRGSFEVLVAGQSGMGNVYGWWRSFRAKWSSAKSTP